MFSRGPDRLRSDHSVPLRTFVMCIDLLSPVDYFRIKQIILQQSFMQWLLSKAFVVFVGLLSDQRRIVNQALAFPLPKNILRAEMKSEGRRACKHTSLPSRMLRLLPEVVVMNADTSEAGGARGCSCQLGNMEPGLY